ncbi:MAG: hypothetical protein V2A69_15920 [Pseudomonadota bacterium]
MPQKFTAPLAIIQGKLGDEFDFSVPVDTPYAPQLTIKDMAGATLYGPAAEDVTRNDYLHWYVEAAHPYGLETEKTYYEVTVDDADPTGYVASTWIVYINDHVDFEAMITRGLGLSGYNLRKYSYTWTRGQLTSYHVKIYTTKAALETADAGGADNYIAHYLVANLYDANYNRYKTTCTKQ